MECQAAIGRCAKENCDATQLVEWIVGVPAAVLTLAYTVILAEPLAARRRMRLH